MVLNPNSVQVNKYEEPKYVAHVADSKKAVDTILLLMEQFETLTDVFVITSGLNTRQVKSIVDEIKKKVKEKTGRHPISSEGLDSFTWVLLDYGDFVVHVFEKYTREIYGLEKLWLDAPRIEWQS